MSKLTLTDTLTIASLGVVAGSRALLAPAMVSRHEQRREHKRGITSSGLLTFLSATELIGDKFPQAPDRIQPVALMGRMVAGGMAGASVGKRLHHKAWVGALIGSATALGAAYLLWYARTRINKHTKIPNGVAGVLEDTLVLCLGHKALQRLS